MEEKLVDVYSRVILMRSTLSAMVKSLRREIAEGDVYAAAKVAAEIGFLKSTYVWTLEEDINEVLKSSFGGPAAKYLHSQLAQVHKGLEQELRNVLDFKSASVEAVPCHHHGGDGVCDSWDCI